MKSQTFLIYIFAIFQLLISGFSLYAAGEDEVVVGETPITDKVTEASDELLDNFIKDTITKIVPYKTAVTTVMDKIGRNFKVNSWEVEYYKITNRDCQDTVRTGFVTSASASGVNGVHTIIVNKPHIYTKDSGIYVQGVLGGDGNPLVLHITNINYDTGALSVIPANGTGAGKDLPDIPANTKLTRLSEAKAEIDAQSDNYTIYPQKESNYIQRFATTIEEGVIEKQHKKEIPWSLAENRTLSLRDFKESKERDILLGDMSKIYNPADRDYNYRTGGLVNRIEKEINFTDANFTTKTKGNAWLDEVCDTVFSDNNGSDSRFWFLGADLIKILNKIDNYQKWLTGNDVTRKLGARFVEVETPFGMLYCIHHRQFPYFGFEEKGIILDIENIEKNTYQALKTEYKDYITPGIKNANGWFTTEMCCYNLTNPDCHAITQRAASSS